MHHFQTQTPVALAQSQVQGQGQPAQQLAQNNNASRPQLNGQSVAQIRSQVNISQQRIPAANTTSAQMLQVQAALLSEPRYRRHPLCPIPLRREHQQRRIPLARRRLRNTKVTLSLRRTCPMFPPRDKIRRQGCTFRRCTGYSSPRSKWNMRCVSN